jgi:uncharacterized repeat protein (TIGR03803 family)
MRNLNLWKAISLACILCAVEAVGSPAQDVQPPSTLTFKTIVKFDMAFDTTDGANPVGPLVQGTDGNLYGVTSSGPMGNTAGTLFKITPAGKLTTLVSFDGTDGSVPSAGLVLATNGNYYGTTDEGGAYGYGTVFKITPAGTLTAIHNFDYSDGSGPNCVLVQATDGNFYGTTSIGGAYDFGTVFKITPAGTLTILHTFDHTDGANPPGGLVQATDGDLYGTTSEGANTACGEAGGGTFFKITLTGKLTTLHRFIDTEGCGPSPLVQAANGNFYGTTYYSGGAYGYGTVFEISPSGAVRTLHSFDYYTDGAQASQLVQGTDGNLYGTTQVGGAKGYGTVFKITAGGTLTTLHSFDRTDGIGPVGGVLQATNGNFYGTVYEGGVTSGECSPMVPPFVNGCGTIFSLSVGLGPFMETNPTSGKVGTKVTILGNKLTGTSRVAFNGKAATFKVVSSSEIRTTVPSGATTGYVRVKTPSRTLTSNVKFRVP